MSERTSIILDVDTGTDDALALAFAVNSPHIDLVAVTTVAGNVGVEKTTANSLAVLDLLGASDIPVHRGASRPLVRPHEDAAWIHDEGGLGGAKIAMSNRSVAADRGPAAIVRLANARPGALTVVAVGPLTNLAIALNVEPRLPELLRALVIMGGAFKQAGNTTPAAEYNIWVDPEAANQVFAAPFREIVAVGLDVTERVALTRGDWDAVAGVPNLSPGAGLFAEVGKHLFTRRGETRFHLHDPLATAIALDRSLAGYEDAEVIVDTEGDDRGRTRIAGPGVTKVAVDVDEERAVHMFRQVLGIPASDA
ncbi:MAG: nucleoside hydrolase [Thermomicrobiales bacterium]